MKTVNYENYNKNMDRKIIIKTWTDENLKEKKEK